MAKETPLYTKLPGRGLRRSVFAVSATRTRLWLAADHLLAVDSTVYTEEYRRFYFRDIEAFVIRRTRRRLVLNVWFGLLAALCGGPFLLLATRPENSATSAAFFGTGAGLATFWLICALVNTLRGQTCETHIRTAVQLEKLPSLGRRRTADRVLARVRPAIESAQGVLAPEEVARAAWAPAPEAAARLLQRKSLVLHSAFFAALILNGMIALLFSLEQSARFLPRFTLGLSTLLAFSLAVLALVRQRGMELAGPVRQLPKAALGTYVLWSIAGFVFLIRYTLHHPQQPAVSGLEVLSEPGFAVFSAGTSALLALLGIGGLVLLRAARFSSDR